MKIAVAQTSPGPDPSVNLESISSFAAQAAGAGARLVVFPEEAMLLADDTTKLSFHALVPPAWGEFEARLKKLAFELSLYIIAGGYEPNGASLPFNTILAFGPDGRELARYHKVHTYDAFTYQESGYVTQGSSLPPVIEVNGLSVGIANCYDVRFPELFRYFADQGVDIISLSAAWVMGKGKEQQWSILTQARAIENVSWLLAAGTVGDDSIGLSRVIDPLGVVVAGANGNDEELLVVEIDEDRLARAREILPALGNRRISLEYAIN